MHTFESSGTKQVCYNKFGLVDDEIVNSRYIGKELRWLHIDLLGLNNIKKYYLILVQKLQFPRNCVRSHFNHI